MEQLSIYKKNEDIKNHQIDLDNGLRGFYSNSFFHIYIDGEFNIDVSQVAEQKDKGTALHEYVHYLQNIGTLWGLYCSINNYETIIEFKKAILSATDIQRPFQFPLTDKIKRTNNYIKLGNGTTDYFPWIIDRHQPLDFKLTPVIINEKQQEQVEVAFTLIGGTNQTVILGAHIIKESMAALYQSLLDPDVAHNDVPYNLVKLLAEQHFPDVAKDTNKMICCCHTSLFSMTPGRSLIELLAEAENTPSINGFELFDKYVHTKEVTTGKGEKKSMLDFFNDMLEGFKTMLEHNLAAPIDYIGMVLDRVRLDGKYYPFLSVLEENGGFSDKVFSDLIGYYGIPYIQTSQYGIHFPRGEKEGGKDGSMDVLELIAQEAVYRNFVDPDKINFCPLYYMCQGSPYEKYECFGKPWEGTMCTYTIVTDYLKLKTKNIK